MDFDREVATKRRTRPQEVESLMHDLLQRQRAADEEDDPNTDELSEEPTGDSGLPGRRLSCVLCPFCLVQDLTLSSTSISSR